jgi:hypothetical protein
MSGSINAMFEKVCDKSFVELSEAEQMKRINEFVQKIACRCQKITGELFDLSPVKCFQSGEDRTKTFFPILFLCLNFGFRLLSVPVKSPDSVTEKPSFHRLLFRISGEDSAPKFYQKTAATN